MKRKIFFWLEKLKINRGERIAVSALIAILLLLFLISTIIPTTSSFDDDYYASLEEVFQTRSKLLQQKEQTMLARYRPQRNDMITVQDTVPRETSKAKKPDAESQPAAAKINVNTADAKTLESLPGIGPAYAGRIVKYRQKNGTFTSYEELLKIKGIGKKRLEKLLPFIQLK